MKKFKKIFILFIFILLIVSLSACSKDKEIESTDSLFPKFTAQDFDGNKIDETIFSKNQATVVNFWFNGCPACVNEIPELDKINKVLSENNCELIGANIDVDDSEDTIKIAKDILKNQGGNYRNIVFDSGQDIGMFLTEIFAFPTTFIVDKNGYIVGDPIVGSISSEEDIDDLMYRIEDIISNYK